MNLHLVAFLYQFQVLFKQMKMKALYILLAIATLACVQSCDKVEEPYMKENAYIWNGRKIIVYDFTGHRCGNCPNAHRALDELTETYGESIIPIAIHGTSFATPITNDTTEPFHYDFRTDIGDFLIGRDTEGYYGELYLPTGLVNNLAADSLSNHNMWGTNIAAVVSSYPEYLVAIEAEYNDSDSIISCDIDITTNIANSRSLSVVVFVLEDHIIQWQEDYSLTESEVEDYEHNHVLRAGVNGAFGEVIKNNTSSTAIGDVLSKSYTQKSGTDWDISNCLIVAFVYDSETEEILQAEMVHLHE